MGTIHSLRVTAGCVSYRIPDQNIIECNIGEHLFLEDQKSKSYIKNGNPILYRYLVNPSKRRFNKDTPLFLVKLFSLE